MVKMRYLKQWNAQRRQHAAFYRQHLCEHVTVPDEKTIGLSVYQTFVVQTEQRNSLRDFLDKNGVDAKVHYPVPIHLQKAADFLGYGKGDSGNRKASATDSEPARAPGPHNRSS